MKARSKSHPKPARVALRPVADLPDASDETPPILERPDGFYWQAPGLTDVGPFETYELACASRDSVGDEVTDRSDALQAKRDIGMNDWIDAQTGQPAEGQSPPHLQEE